MSSRNSLLVLLVCLAFLGAAAFLFLGGGSPTGPVDGGLPGSSSAASQDAGQLTEVTAEGPAAVSPRTEVVEEWVGSPTGVQGIVLDARTLQPLPGVDVAALRRPPGLERLITRLRKAFLEGDGMWTQTGGPVEVLGETRTGPDGRFELLGLEPGLMFLDARADYTFARTPAQLRIARGEIREGVELLGTPGGRVQGTVTGEAAVPLSGIVVSVRPGLNAFLGQITQRKYRWLEAVTDEEGRFDLPGVPEGYGYTVAASGPGMALEEIHGVEVREGRVTWLDVAGGPGARVVGRVVDPDGAPVTGANLAMVYLDVSRLLFSADGRDEPVTTESDGSFVLDGVAPGRIGFIAVADGLAPSPIADLTVVEGGVYEDVELVLGEGSVRRGLVVDDGDQPLQNATIELRPFERPNDPDVLKLALKVRSVEVRTGPDGRFVARGLSGRQLVLQASKEGYVTELRFGVPVESEEELKVVLTRGATVVGRVVGPEGEPVRRFRVRTRSRPADRRRSEGPVPAAADRRAAEDGEAAVAEGAGDRRRGWGRRFGGRRSGSMRLAAGQRLADRELGDDWKELRSADGRFEIVGLPPGRIDVRVRADGFQECERQEVELSPGASSDELEFQLSPGAVARGVVVDGEGGPPVPEALVTAYRERDDGGGGGRGGIFRMNIDPEDFDFLGFRQGSRRSAMTDSHGQFEIDGLDSGRYRFTARHPDRAKASAKEVELPGGEPVEGIVIELDAGGAVEGQVTGAGRRSLPDALIVALSIQAGSMKSSNTDAEGRYRIDGLAPGLYIVFKSRMDAGASNLGYDLLGNMRLKTVTVRRGRSSRLDIHDESENGVRVFGTVHDGNEVVARAMVTALGTDTEGPFGLGIRAKPTDGQGNYELAGLKPGSYFFQIARFQGRPEQANLSVEVPEGVSELRIDLHLPQSFVSGRVVDSNGQPVAGVRVSAGLEDGGSERAPGLLGVILRNGAAQARTGEDGTFRLNRLAEGTWRIVASGRQLGGGRGRGRGDGGARYGETSVEGVVVDGVTPVPDLVITIPLAGRITGTVVDGNGAPVAGAEIVASRDDARAIDPAGEIMDLFGVQARPVRTDSAGRFELGGVTPGTYRVRADAEGLSPGVAEDVAVVEGGVIDVSIRVVRGATLRVRARNVDGEQIPFAQVTLLDGKGKPLASKVSVASVFRRLMGNQRKKEDTGWYEVGSVPPDTYTVIITEEGQPEVRFTREIRDGETVEWDIDLAAELERRGRGR